MHFTPDALAMQTGTCENINGRFRDEALNEQWSLVPRC